MIEIENLPAMLVAYQNRWAERDERMAVMASVVSGDWSVTGDDGAEMENRSPNVIQVAIEDTAEAASLVPSIRAKPSGGTKRKTEQALKMEQIGASYFDQSQIELLVISKMLNLTAYGMYSLVSVISEETGTPYLQWRDPRTCYPEPGWNPMDTVKRCMFVREVYLTQLPDEYQAKILASFSERRMQERGYWNDKRITLVEYYDKMEIVVAALYKSNSGTLSRSTKSYIPIELHREETVGGICPVVVQQRVTLDSEPRGQFDQVVDVMVAHIRLMGTVLDYADQAVYSDVWVKDLIGEMPMGGGSYIQLGAQGAIGRVSPAVTSLSVFEELSTLMDAVHLGGRWPKVRPGEVDQAIASAKFVEATAGVMNTAIRTMHLISKRGLEQALRIMFKQDYEVGPDRTVAGVLRNQQFQIERKRDDIDLAARVSVEYGLGLGRDPAQSMVLGIQAAGAGLISTEFVQENFEGIQDVERERARIDVQQMRDMAFAQLMQGLESGEVPKSALPKIAAARKMGHDIFELFQEHIVAPMEEQQASMLTSGIDGSQMAPGADPLAALMGAAPPPPPGAGELIPGGPPAGPENSTVSRTSIPMGGGSFAGVESRG